MQAVNAFRTTDDKIFFDQAEADVHQRTIDSEAAIEAFAKAHDINGRTLVGLKRYIPMWDAFNAPAPLQEAASAVEPETKASKKAA